MGRTATDLRKSGWPEKVIANYYPWKAIERYHLDDELKTRKKRAMVISQKIATMLKEKYRARRVILFGSLAHGEWFTPRSDIDIYAEGIDPNNFFKAEGDVLEMSKGYRADFVVPEDCPPEMLIKIEQEGVEL